MFILAQVLSFIAMLINIVAVQLKTKKNILLTIVVSNIFFIISYILLEAYMGAIMCGIVAIEIIINTILESKNKSTPKILIIIYIIISIILGSITYTSILDLLPIIASIFFVFTLIQKKESNVRLLILGNLISWVIYDILVSAYISGISDFLTIISTVTAIVRYDILKNKIKEE